MNQQQGSIHDIITPKKWESKYKQIMRLFKYIGLLKYYYLKDRAGERNWLTLLVV